MENKLKTAFISTTVNSLVSMIHQELLSTQVLHREFGQRVLLLAFLPFPLLSFLPVFLVQPPTSASLLLHTI